MELLRSRERGEPQRPSGLFDEQGDDANSTSAIVISGPYMEALPVAGLTVAQVRERMGERLDIDPRSIAVIDGRDVSDNTVVRPSSTLVFMTRAGEKGAIV